MSDHAIRTEDAGGLEARVLSSPELEATFVPGAGMIGASLRHEGSELLGQRGGLEAWTGRASTFGIPLLHPWANRLSAWEYAAGGKEVSLEGNPRAKAEEHGLPIHGLLGPAPWWEVVSSDASSAGASLEARLDFGARSELLAGFPFPHVLELAVTLRDLELTCGLTLVPGDEPVPVAFGWHPYFAIPGVPRAEWVVEAPVHSHLLLDENQIPTGEREAVSPLSGPLGDQTFDDGYDDVAEGAEFALVGGGRRVVVRFGEGYPCAQIFAPPHMDVVCFEPMAAPANALISGDGLRWADPGTPFRAGFAVRVEQVR